MFRRLCDLSAAITKYVQPPSNTLAFDIHLPSLSSLKHIVSAVIALVGVGRIHSLQHSGNNSLFQVTLKVRPPTLRPSVRLYVSPCCSEVSFLHLPALVTDEALVQAILSYAKVQSLTRTTYQDFPDIDTGTRLLTVIMVDGKPNPN